MKKIIILALLASTSPAFAQQQPTLEQIQAQYLIETGQLRQALGQAQSQIIQLHRELDAIKKPIETKEKK